MRYIGFIEARKAQIWYDKGTELWTVQVMTGLPSPNNIIQPSRTSLTAALDDAVEQWDKWHTKRRKKMNIDQIAAEAWGQIAMHKDERAIAIIKSAIEKAVRMAEQSGSLMCDNCGNYLKPRTALNLADAQNVAIEKTDELEAWRQGYEVGLAERVTPETVEESRAAQASEDVDTTCSHPDPMIGCPVCGEWLRPAQASGGEKWTRHEVGKHVEIRWVNGKHIASFLEYTNEIDSMYLAHNAALQPREDTKRLDWLLKHPNAIQCHGDWFAKGIGYFKTSREAIDAAMKEQK